MLAYAAHRRPAGASASPRALAFVVGAHAVALGLVLTAKPDLIPRIPIVDTDIFNVPLNPTPPPPPPPETRDNPQQPTKSTITVRKPIIPVPSDGPVAPFDPGPDPSQLAGPARADELGHRCGGRADQVGRAPVGPRRVRARVRQLEQGRELVEPIGDLGVVRL